MQEIIHKLPKWLEEAFAEEQPETIQVCDGIEELLEPSKILEQIEYHELKIRELHRKLSDTLNKKRKG